MSTPVQRACTWCGPAFALMLFAGLLLAGLLPPESPGRTAEEVAAFYRDDTDLIRFGLLVMLVGAGLSGPFAAVISVHLHRIEGRHTPMSFTQLIAGAVGLPVIIVPALLFTAAAFRPDRPADVTQAIDDAAWLSLVMNIAPATLQCLAVGIAVLVSQRATQVFPRWVGYYSLWTAVLFLPGGLVTFFKTGAFAWNGLLAFWVAAIAFGAWFIVMTVMLLRAIREQETADLQPAT